MTDLGSVSRHLLQPLLFKKKQKKTFISREVLKVSSPATLYTFAHVKHFTCSRLTHLLDVPPKTAGFFCFFWGGGGVFFLKHVVCVQCVYKTDTWLPDKLPRIILPSLLKQNVKRKQRFVCWSSVLLLAFDVFIRRRNQVCVPAPGDSVVSLK